MKLAQEVYGVKITFPIAGLQVHNGANSSTYFKIVAACSRRTFAHLLLVLMGILVVLMLYVLEWGVFAEMHLAVMSIHFSAIAALTAGKLFHTIVRIGAIAVYPQSSDVIFIHTFRSKI